MFYNPICVVMTMCAQKLHLYVAIVIISMYPVSHGMSQEISNDSNVDRILTRFSDTLQSIGTIKSKAVDQYTSQALRDTTLYSSLAKISKPMAPFVYGQYFIFIHYTTDPNDRVFISFERDNYNQLFSYITLEANTDVRVFVLPGTHTTQTLRYRVVINNLWSSDPQNPRTIVDANGIRVSMVTIPPVNPLFLPPVVIVNNNTMRFYLYIYMGAFPLKDTRLHHIDYSALSSSQIYLSGDFTGWNPYLIPMRPVENANNLYYADVPVREGTYYYYYNLGATDALDPKNNAMVKRRATGTYVNMVEVRTEIKETTGAKTLVVSTMDTQ